MCVLCSCTSTYKEIKFIEITNVHLGSAQGTAVALTGDCILYNPNDVALVLTDATFQVYIDGRKTAVVHQDTTVIMPAKERFVLSLNATIDAKNFYDEQGKGLFSAAIQVLAKQKITVKYDGVVKVGKGSVTFPVKVLDSVEVPVNFY